MMIGDPRSWMWQEACAIFERAERVHRQFFSARRFGRGGREPNETEPGRAETSSARQAARSA
jgi:hypothetical protein